ncbi:MAG: MATE family efflux transporter [Emcibacteraceae bacterium]|nr:MATE family efflux transporter [Emcibacteraceae bacterium]
MTQAVHKYDPIEGKVSPVFWHYAIPEIFGLFAMSSASLVDSIFLGNFVGPKALATVNLSIPAMTLFFALAMLISVGGSVVGGKYVGEKRPNMANSVFTTTVMVGLFIAFLLMFFGLVFLDELVVALGATDPELAQMLKVYLGIIFWATPFYLIEIVGFYFVRLSGRPILASGAFIVGAVVNIGLDYLFIVEFNWGVAGAAYATLISAGTTCLILAPAFFTKNAKLRLSKPMTDVKELLKAYFNGISEFANEASIGITALIFNWVMITRIGMEGVAALTILNNIWMLGVYVSIGMCDSLQPIISQNYGARNHERIVEFLKIAVYAVLGVGVVMIIAMIGFPDILIDVFLEEGEEKTKSIAAQFMMYVWPAFLFIGLNILLSTYFTSMHKPMPSMYIAFSRSFILPVAALTILPIWLGNVGIFIALPIAEAGTFFMALYFYMKRKPQDIIERETAAK